MDTINPLFGYVGLLIVALLIFMIVYLLLRRAMSKLVGLNKNKRVSRSHSSADEDLEGITISSIPKSPDEKRFSVSKHSFSSMHSPPSIQNPRADGRFRFRRQVVDLDEIHPLYGRKVRDCTCPRCMKIKREFNGGR